MFIFVFVVPFGIILIAEINTYIKVNNIQKPLFMFKITLTFKLKIREHNKQSIIINQKEKFENAQNKMTISLLIYVCKVHFYSYIIIKLKFILMFFSFS